MSGPRAIFRLRYPAICDGCETLLRPGSMARRLRGSTYACMACTPVTSLPAGRAEGAEDSTTPKAAANLRARLEQGQGRRRLPMHLRRSKQR